MSHASRRTVRTVSRDAVAPERQQMLSTGKMATSEPVRGVVGRGERAFSVFGMIKRRRFDSLVVLFTSVCCNMLELSVSFGAGGAGGELLG